MGDIKEDLRKIPHWVWVGVAGAVTLLYFLNRGSNNAASTGAASADPLSSQVDGGTTTGGASTDPLSTFLSEWSALQSMNNPAPGPGTTSQQLTTTDNSNPNGIGLPTAAYNPISLDNSGLLPTTSLPTQAGIDTAQQAIQNMLGVYGGAPVSVTNPDVGLGSTWDDVTQTIYAGGGVVTNLGIAQPAPAVGAVVPPAVQDTTIYNPGTSVVNQQATQAGAYYYAPGFKPGQTQPAGGGSLASVIQQEINSGLITQAQGEASAKSSGITL